MEERRKISILIGLLAVLLITGGCGWFAGNDYSPSSAPEDPSATNLSSPTLAAARSLPYITQVFLADPDEGFLPGGEAVRLQGLYPNLASAETLYTVYFGNNVADYDTNFASVFTRNNVYVVAPPGDAFGPVNVSILDNITRSYIAYDYNIYTYVDPFELFEVVPPTGVLVGGNDVTLLGRIPISAPITDLFVAQNQYKVFFGNNAATNIPNALGEYVTAGAVYVEVPPGDIPGFVDVALNLGQIYGYRALEDGYRYLDDFELFSVNPNRGHVSGGTPTVALGGSFPVSGPINDIATAASYYTAYFGTTPATFVQPAGFPVITADTMYVSPPAAASAGVVDVNLYAIAQSRFAYVNDPANNDYEYFTLMKLGEVYPDFGFLGVNTPVDIVAKLPLTQDVTQLATADSYYSVNIDGVAAAYDTSITPLIEITAAYGEYNAIMHMLTPPGTVVGPADVVLNDVLGIEPSDTLVDGYTYRSLMELIYIYPDRGPTAGGTQVDVLVNIPMDPNLAPITSLTQAEAMYEVEIDGNMALFDITRQPLIGINTISTTYNAYFHMITPPGTVGYKVGTLIDLYGTLPDATKIDAFEYISGSSIGELTSVTIEPNPVGPLAAGELQVVVEVTGSMVDAEVFIVPQGGDPANADHRILLQGSGDPVWTGTNSSAITTEVFGSGINTLYADGHAALFLQDDSGEIIGDDYTDPSDGGIILGSAQETRHFIIDTLPPMMAVLPGQTADDTLVYVPFQVFGATSYKADIAGVDPLTHPTFALIQPTGSLANTENFPSSSNTLNAIPTLLSQPLSQTGIQRFFNVASKSNNINTTEFFRPVVRVTFVDVDLYNHFQYPDAINSNYNEDRFDPGQTYRAPAGFLFGNGVNFLSSIGNSREILLAAPANANLPARWELEGGSTPLPDMEEVYAAFTLGGSLITNGFVYNINTDDDPYSQMTAIWDLRSGANPLTEVDPSRLVIKFAAADRAGLYYPLGNTSMPARAIMTRRDNQLDPLQIWWMREVNTEITQDNIQADETTRAPEIAWTIANEPRPVLDSGDLAQPLYQYEIWSTQSSANIDDYRDGPYSRLATGPWSPFNTQFLSGDFQLLAPDENAWYLFVVTAIDEAGNVEQWPAELFTDGTSPITIGQNTQQDSNWRRFYYPSQQSQIDTRVTKIEFFHGAVSVGNNTIVPMPGNTTIPVNAEFTGEVISSLNVSTTIDWTLTENGNVFAGATGPTPNPTTFSATGLGDPNRLRPYTYVLTAQATTTSGPLITDPTPVNIRFTVVPQESIADFLKNSQTDDAQPIKEFDRE